MLNKVRELLQGADGTRMPWKDRMLSCIEKNNEIRKRPKEVISDLMEHALRENMGAKASAVHLRDSSPEKFDYAGLQREVEQEMEVQFPDSGGHDAE